MAKLRSTPKRNLSERLQEAFGKRLQEARKLSIPRCSQQDLARGLDVTRTTISNIENGRHRIFLDQVYDAARVLNVPLSNLLPELAEVIELPKPSVSGIAAGSLDQVQMLIREKQDPAYLKAIQGSHKEKKDKRP